MVPYCDLVTFRSFGGTTATGRVHGVVFCQRRRLDTRTLNNYYVAVTTSGLHNFLFSDFRIQNFFFTPIPADEHTTGRRTDQTKCILTTSPNAQTQLQSHNNQPSNDGNSVEEEDKVTQYCLMDTVCWFYVDISLSYADSKHFEGLFGVLPIRSFRTNKS